MSLADQVRANHRMHIRSFLTENKELFRDKIVLDFGSGKEPYRDIVESVNGEYVPFDSPSNPGSVVEKVTGPVWPIFSDLYDVILSTQVVQYLPYPATIFDDWHGLLSDKSGTLIMSYPTNWPVVERDDLWRWTPAGMQATLEDSNFRNIRHEPGSAFVMDDFILPLENYVIAQV